MTLLPSMSERTRNILTGMVATVLSLSLVTFGVRAASGALRPTYSVAGLFSSAGQGLISGSDVKVRGVDIGRVSSVELQDGRALVHLQIDSDERIPVDARAVIRPKTLFGEKFVDIEPGPHEQTGPYLADGGALSDTVGGFELQEVLNDAFPILAAIDPAELGTVLDVLAEGGRGLGGEVNRSIRNGAAASDVGAAHDDDTRRFLRDLDSLSETLADSSDDLIAAASDLNRVLPDLIEREDQLTAVLEQSARLSGDVADLLVANRDFLEHNITEGGKALSLLAAERAQLQPLVVGVRQFVQTLAEVLRIPLADGSRLAAVKYIAGGGDPRGQDATPSGAGTATPESGPIIELPPLPVAGAEAIEQLLGAVLP